MLKALPEPAKRGPIGFVAGLVVAEFSLTFLGVLHGHSDLSQVELEQEYWGLRVALYIACGFAVFAMLAGKRRVSIFRLEFSVAFAIICGIPCWPDKSGGLLPFGTPYVNFGFEPADAILLAIHVSLALALATLVHWFWPLLRKRAAT